ncbi:GTP-binding protein ERG [Acorus gramineus]|uniref:GTP-binding protein ERG n=1 Tax=Acorus gramineus TaxID=55184 RepID=A0AAV9AZJ7_ACOGR|nr:GTP-binding protein ERG [Acorus gramineus]KAK1279939.1 GTP-binding protein ERG [Acorus gramineus]
MQVWRRALERGLTSLSNPNNSTYLSIFVSLSRFRSSQTLQDDEEPSTPAPADFDSTDFSISHTKLATSKPIWDAKYRARADQALFRGKGSGLPLKEEEREEEEEEAALANPDEVDEEEMVEAVGVREEDQRSLSVGLVGAPNAGKSALMNFMVGTKISAVSRKSNTTTHEMLGVMTKGNTQICFFDTPGLISKRDSRPDVKVRVESAWGSLNLYDILVVIVDVHRHLTKPDSRVTRLVMNLGKEEQQKQKRVLCMNKIDLVEAKKDLLKVADQFKDLPGYERYFMISGLRGSGIKDLTQYMMEQAVKRPWDEDPTVMSEDMMKNISLEVVREKMLHHIHQEIPYVIDHRLMNWNELKDGSLRIEQHFITTKQSQRQILVGKKGSKIGRIGMEANEELRSLFKREVHLILLVRVGRVNIR